MLAVHREHLLLQMLNVIKKTLHCATDGFVLSMLCEMITTEV